jgi:hypothetical protein
MQDAVIPLVVPMKTVTEPLQTMLGLSPQLNWRLPTPPRSFTTMDCGPEVTSSISGAQKPKSKISGGNQISRGGFVDRGPFLQTLEDQQVLMARE